MPLGQPSAIAAARAALARLIGGARVEHQLLQHRFVRTRIRQQRADVVSLEDTMLRDHTSFNQ